ncbi:MAG TPA: regulatory protein RecX [Solirubrobacteraceae bacterium]|nr:regulatory protein RecX [Solirubrobacteraceae bacterium]
MTFEDALGRAYRFLGHRDRTCAEIEKHLSRAGEDAAVTREVVEELKTQGYLNDARFAKAFAEDRRKLDGWSSGRIYARLIQLGIAEELAQDTVSEAGIGDDVEAAVALLHARVRMVPTDPRARNRAFGVLARRGYDADVAYDALRRFERGANL